MRLTVVQLGRLRDTHVLALRDEYVKRFARFGKLAIVERPRDGDPWPSSSRWRVACCVDGAATSSEGLADLLRRRTMAHGEVAFMVGDADGIPAAALAPAQERMSLGPLTLPHHLAHLVLVEQLYRAATILAGLPYHHA